jgi:serine protease Do
LHSSTASFNNDGCFGTILLSLTRIFFLLETRMKSRFFPVVLTAAVTSLATLFAASKLGDRLPFVAAAPSTEGAVPVNYRFANAAPTPGAPPADFEAAASSSVKAVVHIKTSTKSRTVTYQDPWAQLWGFDGNRQMRIPPQMGSGSGVVYTPDGYIVTNNHVVAGAETVTVTFNDRVEKAARVVASDPATDIAVVKVDGKDFDFMEFGNSDDVRLGQWVLAVGYPLSLDATVTAGIVSAKSRAIGINRTQSSSAIESFIQTDAAVNPGNSGGALVNTSGQLIGINSAIASPTGSYAGYSYAVPSNLVRKVVNDLVQYGSLQRGYLGISLIDSKQLSRERREELGLDRTDGVYVGGTSEGSGAERAGIKEGDFVTSINGVAVNTEPQLLEQVARYKPGDNISVTYLRSGKSQTATVQLQNESGTTAVVRNAGAVKILGATMRPLTTAERSKLAVRSGVIVTDVGDGAIAEQTNMRSGFIITSINDKPVATVADAQRLLQGAASSTQIAGFYEGRRGMYYYGLNGAASRSNVN